jgi:hypothetical protein
MSEKERARQQPAAHIQNAAMAAFRWMKKKKAQEDDNELHSSVCQALSLRSTSTMTFGWMKQGSHLRFSRRWAGYAWRHHQDDEETKHEKLAAMKHALGG